jgi:MFS superfamily sulfate permease-like transporter
MDNLHHITHAYSQAPWRRQTYLIGVILLILVSAAIVAGIYLNVTASAAAVGREIQEMQVRVYGYHYLNASVDENDVPIEELEQNIANLSSQLAYLTSYSVLQARVKDLGLEPIDASHIDYMEVPGYIERQTTSLAPPPEPVVVNASIIAPEFKESLFEWVTDQVRKTVRLFGEAGP